MGDKLEGDDSSCCDLPMEVLNEILIYLPVKSLIRFTCVCKSWLYLIRTDPRFPMTHYLVKTTSSSTLMDNVDYIVDYGKTVRVGRSLSSEEVSSLCMYSLTEKKTFRLVKRFHFGPKLDVHPQNICHGIMCMYVFSASTRSRRAAKFLLCNPAIREVVTLPISLNIARYGFPGSVGFGFDPLSKDYKIVVAHNPAIIFGRPSWLVDVYSVRNGCWHSLDANAIGSLEKFDRFTCGPVLNENGRILNWLTYLKSETKTKTPTGLMSFDMVDEVFREIPMPECPYPIRFRQHNLLPSSRWLSCICCSPYSYFDLRRDEYFNSVDIWVLSGSFEAANGNDNVGVGHDHIIWSKQVSVACPGEGVVVGPLDIWMNDKELFVYMQKQRNDVEEVFHYDLGNQQLKRTGRRGMFDCPVGYVESLVSIKRLISAYHDQDQMALGKPNGSGVNKEGNQEQEDGGGSVCFIREVGRRNNDVRWSYSFNV